MRQCLALLDGKFSRCVQSVEVLVIFIAGDGELVRHLLDIYWTLAGHLLDTCWTFTGHPRRRWVGTRIEYGQGAHVADRYGDGPTAEYAESAERASVVGIWGTVAHACGFVKYLNCDWGTENSLHWVLDMAFDEDRSRGQDWQCGPELGGRQAYGGEHAQTGNNRKGRHQGQAEEGRMGL